MAETLPKSEQKPPALPLAPSAAPKPTPNPTEKSSISEATASALTTPEAKEETWMEGFEKIKGVLKENGVLDSPLAGGFLVFAAAFLKYGNYYMDFLPGNFEKRVEENTEELSENEKKEIKKAQAKKEMTKEEKQKLAEEGKKHGIERASTKYAAKVLWGFDNIESPESLFSKLNNSRDQDKPLYEKTDLIKMKTGGVPFGTLIAFSPSLAEPEKIVAFATGNKDEFEYFDPKKGEPVRFNLSSPSSPVKNFVFYAMWPVKTNPTATSSLEKKA